jgi:hypothetical protein
MHEARGLVLEIQLGTQSPVASLGEGGLGMTDREKRSYSVVRAVQALVTGDWKRAGFEREVSLNLQKQVDAQAAELGIERPRARARLHAAARPAVRAGREAPARLAPAGRRARSPQMRAPYQVGTAGQGGNLVATNLLADNFIEVLRNASVTAQLGARYLTDLVGKVDIPRQNAAMTVGWVGESTAGAERSHLRQGVAHAEDRHGLVGDVAADDAAGDAGDRDARPRGPARRDGPGAGPGRAVRHRLERPAAGHRQPVGRRLGGRRHERREPDVRSHHPAQDAPRVANASIANMAFAINSKTKGYLETQKASTGQYLWTEGGYAGVRAPT